MEPPSVPGGHSPFIASEPPTSFPGITDEYDPLRPNDYEDVVARRKEQRQREREEERRKEAEERRSDCLPLIPVPYPDCRNQCLISLCYRSRRRDSDSDSDDEFERRRRRREEREDDDPDKSRRSGLSSQSSCVRLLYACSLSQQGRLVLPLLLPHH